MAALLLAAHLMLNRRGVTPTLARLASGRVTAEVRPSDAMGALRRPARILGAPCLAQSVALTAALSRARQTPSLVLGCRRYDDGRWGAHAWVDVDGVTFDAIPSGEHQPLARLAADTGWIPAPV